MSYMPLSEKVLDEWDLQTLWMHIHVCACSFSEMLVYIYMYIYLYMHEKHSSQTEEPEGSCVCHFVLGCFGRSVGAAGYGSQEASLGIAR